MARIFISDLNGKDEVESVFLIKLFNTNEARDGKKYFQVVLTDSTGEIDARYWNYSEDFAKSFAKNNFVKVSGRVNIFQGKKQFIISQMQKISEKEIDINDFIMRAKEHPDKMYQELLEIVVNLKDVYIKELLLQILKDPEISRRLKIWQAGKSIHHAYQSGLLEHILSCVKLGIGLSSHYNVNASYVIAGCILHDLCKIYELSDGYNTDYTEEGKLVGHLVKGLEIVDRFSYRIKNFPYQMKLHLKHILLSHHGEFAFGSPKLPHTSEAYLVHLIDFMDSKMNSLEMIKRADSATGNWTGFVKHLDRMVYKSDLPTYTEFIKDEADSEVVSKKSSSKDVKTNLAKMLEGFKLEEE